MSAVIGVLAYLASAVFVWLLMMRREAKGSRAGVVFEPVNLIFDWLGLEKEIERAVPKVPTKRRKICWDYAPRGGKIVASSNGGDTFTVLTQDGVSRSGVLIDGVLGSYSAEGDRIVRARQLLDLIDHPDEPATPERLTDADLWNIVQAN